MSYSGGVNQMHPLFSLTSLPPPLLSLNTRNGNGNGPESPETNKLWEKHFSDFLSSIKSDLSSSEKFSGEPATTKDFDANVLTEERIILAPIAQMKPRASPSTEEQESRKSSPILAAVVSNRTSPAIRKNEDITDVSMETLLRVSFTEFHNNPKFADDNDSAYLGEELSLKPSNAFGSKSLRHDFMRLRRASSLELDKYEKKPTLMALPFVKSYVDWGESLEGISPFSWIVPFILSCLPEDLLAGMMSLARNAQTIAHRRMRYKVRSTNGDVLSRSSSATSDDLDYLETIIDEEGVQVLSFSEHDTKNRNNSSTLHHGNSQIHAASPFRYSWKYIGMLYFNRDPSWCTWEPRIAYLFDNYLIECIVMNDAITNKSSHKLIGYAQLCEAIITNEVTRDEDFPTLGMRAFKVQYYSSSKRSSFRESVWVRTFAEDCMEGLEKDLVLAAGMNSDGIYENAPGPMENVLLGKGRCNEVRMARRRNKSTLSNTKFPTIDSYIPTKKNMTADVREKRVLPEHHTQQLDNSMRSGAVVSEDYNALKIISKEGFWQRVQSGKERADAIVREVLAQSLVCQYANKLNSEEDFPIVKLYGMLETLDDFSLELELMKSMDLFDQLSQDGVLPESTVIDIATQLTLASKLCMGVGIAHRDIKLSNITFPRDDHTNEASSSSVRVKLADFGMAGFKDKDGLLRGRCGTPGYVAPDILKAGVQEGYALNIDMFSIGVVCYTLLCGYEPFYGTDDTQLIKANKNVHYEFHLPEWGDISDNAKDWIRKCMSPYANSRLKPEEALAHVWLNQNAKHPLKRFYTNECVDNWDVVKWKIVHVYDECMQAIRLSKVANC